MNNETTPISGHEKLGRAIHFPFALVGLIILGICTVIGSIGLLLIGKGGWVINSPWNEPEDMCTLILEANADKLKK